jgi:sugar/nucleoside kinase (ribokinase family)
VVLDQASGGNWVPGGPSLYSARQALALGASVILVTNLSPGYPANALAGLDLVSTACRDVPRYVNSYDAEGNRQQRLLVTGAPLDPAPSLFEGADALLFAPAFHELDETPAPASALLGVSLQGALRDLDGDRVIPRADPLRACLPMVRPRACCFFSEEDTADPLELAAAIARHGATAIVTRGYRGAIRFEPDGTVTRRDAYPADVVDPTGAGDAFATAYLVRLAETGDPDAAFTFALVAGALAVERIGLDGIPTRHDIEARLRKVAA